MMTTRGMLCALLALLATACAAPARKKEAPVAFPPPPELPRILYLTSFSGMRDIQSQSAFNRFVVGEQEDIKLGKPYGIATWEGRIYVCDTNGTVVVFDMKSHLFELLKGAVGQGKLTQPTNISIDAEGIKYVADPVRGQIVVFGQNDEYLRTYGEPGSWRPVDVATFDDRVYIADIQNGLVRIFDKQGGEMIKSIGDKGEPSERLDRPTNLAFDREGYLYVTDVGRFQVVKYDRDGHFKSTFGRPGDNLGHFARPKGIALDRDGLLYAVDASFNNVQIFDQAGHILMFFGGPGDAPGSFTLPAKVTIDYDSLTYFKDLVPPDFSADYLVLVTGQFGPRLVNVFAYGREKGRKYPTEEELLKQLEERRLKEAAPHPDVNPATSKGEGANPPAKPQDEPKP